MLVHGLLDLALAQGAEALILRPDRPPTLLRGSTDMPLSMPPLARELYDELRAELEGLSDVEVDGQSFSITAEENRLVLRRPGTSESKPPPSETPPTFTTGEPPTPATAGEFGIWVSEAMRQGASDIFFSSGRPPFVRRGGEVVPLASGTIDDASLRAFAMPLLGTANVAHLEAQGSVDTGWQHGQARFRVHVFEQHDGLSLALRPIRNKAPTLLELGLPESFHRLTQYRDGLVLMTGTAGAGKSTTLVALLERLCRTSAKHIVTLEDPIEHRFASNTALVHQREVGTHVPSFAEGLRAAMREAPDVILLGELRDRETIAAALTAAETGHLVLSTLHCANSATAVDRIVDVFEEHRHALVRTQLASVLRAVVSQTLLLSKQPLRRVPAYELLLVNTAVASKIREGRGHQIRSELHPGRSEGMVPLEVTLDALVERGEITREQAKRAAPNANLLTA